MLKNIIKRIPTVRRFRIRSVIGIAILWTLTDTIGVLLFGNLPGGHKPEAVLLREAIVFISSLIMGYLLVVQLREMLRNFNLLITLILKSFILIVAALVINLLIYSINSVSVLGITIGESFHRFYLDSFDIIKLLQKIVFWLVLFLITQLLIELNEKYSPGVFIDILLGKYVEPKIEKRIVMFLDLKDSTPIAEKLGSREYFKFIREFIYQVSDALIQYGGRIYQYVGDEVVVSWLLTPDNSRKTILALKKVKKNISRQSSLFMHIYGVMPEFRVGIHVGEVTVGEIGVIKKDLAMSGDTMNTAARIRTATAELDTQVLVSKEFADIMNSFNWKGESVGMVELKGKASEMELFALNI